MNPSKRCGWLMWLFFAIGFFGWQICHAQNSTLNDKFTFYCKMDDDGVWTDEIGTNDLVENSVNATTASGIVNLGFDSYVPTNQYYLYHADAAEFSFGDVSMGIVCSLIFGSEFSDFPGVVTKDNVTSGNRNYGILWWKSTDTFSFYRGTTGTSIISADVVITPAPLGDTLIIIGWFNKDVDRVYLRIWDMNTEIGFDSTDYVGTAYDSGVQIQFGRLAGSYNGDWILDEVGIFSSIPTTQEQNDYVAAMRNGDSFPLPDTTPQEEEPATEVKRTFDTFDGFKTW